MNVNFGLFKELPKNNARKLKKEMKKVALTTKAKKEIISSTKSLVITLALFHLLLFLRMIEI